MNSELCDRDFGQGHPSFAHQPAFHQVLGKELQGKDHKRLNLNLISVQPQRNTKSVLYRLIKIVCFILYPFYFVGWLFTSLLSLILTSLTCVFYVVIFWRFPGSNNRGNLECYSNNYIIENRYEDDVHSKVIACPKCDHLHYSRNCECHDCLSTRPEVIECLRYHESGAQFLMCPCVDCKIKRPINKTCRHCVIVSNQLHKQAGSTKDIEIKTRPRSST